MSSSITFRLSCTESIRSNTYEHDFKRSTWLGNGHLARGDHGLAFVLAQTCAD